MKNLSESLHKSVLNYLPEFFHGVLCVPTLFIDSHRTMVAQINGPLMVEVSRETSRTLYEFEAVFFADLFFHFLVLKQILLRLNLNSE